MTVTKNGVKWYSGKWQGIKYCTVKNKNHCLYEYLQENIKNGNFSADENIVQYFLINGAKITLDDLYSRYGIMGFDFKAEEYPKNINCYTDYFSIFSPVYCELDEYGENLRIWKIKK